MPDQTDFDPEAVDAALAKWEQGDCLIEGEHWFVSTALADGEVQTQESQVLGFAVTTQTCDLVRSVSTRPWVEVSPLVEISADRLAQVQKAQMIQFAYLPALAARNWVVDIDRTMTVHKSVVAQWTRTPSFLDHISGRTFSQALARKRSRKAFPDDFVEMIRELQSFVKAKHGKDSPDGRALEDLREIRVTPEPSWSGHDIKLTFWFIWHDWTKIEREVRASTAGRWCSKVRASGRFTSVSHAGVILPDMRADEYVFSDPLDFDYLSDAR